MRRYLDTYITGDAAGEMYSVTTNELARYVPGKVLYPHATIYRPVDLEHAFRPDDEPPAGAKRRLRDVEQLFAEYAARPVQHTGTILFRVRHLRQQLGISQAELSRRCGLRQATLSVIENNLTTGIDLTTLELLTRELNCAIGELFHRA